MREILSGATVQITAGEWVAVTGPSGVGKTTLLHILAGILPPDAGQVLWEGNDLYAMAEPDRDRRRAVGIGLVFQFHHLLPDLTVEENIRLPLTMAGQNGRPEETRRTVNDLLARLGLTDFAGARIEKLSGGERQRVAVARAMVHRPSLIFADEPTGNLDDRSAAAVLELFEHARSQAGAAIVLSSHNPAVCARASRRLVIRAGQLHEAG